MAEGTQAHRQGRLDHALRCYENVLRQQPSHFAANYQAGVLQLQAGRIADSLRLLATAVEVNPNDADAAVDYGAALVMAESPQKAMTSFARAIAINPRHAGAYINRANALAALGQPVEAIETIDTASTIDPSNPLIFNNRGNYLSQLGRFEEALASYSKALALAPKFAAALRNSGNALIYLNRDAEALLRYREAVQLNPDDAQAHYAVAFASLRQGDYSRGFVSYEWRWRLAEFATQRRDFAQPLWRGDEDIEGKTVLLHAEQGVGDTLLFMRYAAVVAARGARVILEVQPPLWRLIRGVPGLLVVSRGDSLPSFDLHCWLLSLPRILKTTLETVPPQLDLRSDPQLVAYWRKKLPAEGLKVGIVWSGNRAQKDDRDRSIPFNQILPLLTAQNVSFVTLNPDLSAEEKEALLGFPQVMMIGSEFRDFADTAAVVDNLDLVISADTASAHLAGALGTEVWVLLRYSPAWQWLLGRDDSPWYRTARLWRQTSTAGWPELVDRVARSLATRATERRGRDA